MLNLTYNRLNGTNDQLKEAATQFMTACIHLSVTRFRAAYYFWTTFSMSYFPYQSPVAKIWIKMTKNPSLLINVRVEASGIVQSLLHPRDFVPFHARVDLVQSDGAFYIS